MTGPRSLDDDDDYADDGRYDSKIFSVNPQERQAAAIAANDRFVAAMNAAIAKRREIVQAGTVVDTSPPVYAKRLRGDPPMSVCGSPSAMCIESAVQQDGAATMK